METLKVASCQFPVNADIAANARCIPRYLRRAANAGAHLLHTSEASLSGYAGVDFPSFEGFDWDLWLGPAAERPDLVERLSRAYRRGDIATSRHGEIAALLVKNAKELAAPWIQRTAATWDSFPVVERHASWLAGTRATREAALYLVEARGKALFERAEGSR